MPMLLVPDYPRDLSDSSLRRMRLQLASNLPWAGNERIKWTRAVFRLSVHEHRALALFW